MRKAGAFCVTLRLFKVMRFEYKKHHTRIECGAWSWWGDSNTLPADYEVYPSTPFGGFQGFWSLSARHIPRISTYPFHCFHPLISPCGSACGSSPLALHRGFSNDNRAYSTALYVLKPYHLPNAAGDMALTLEDTARFGYVRQSGAVQSSEYSELY